MVHLVLLRNPIFGGYNVFQNEVKKMWDASQMLVGYPPIQYQLTQYSQSYVQQQYTVAQQPQPQHSLPVHEHGSTYHWGSTNSYTTQQQSQGSPRGTKVGHSNINNSSNNNSHYNSSNSSNNNVDNGNNTCSNSNSHSNSENDWYRNGQTGYSNVREGADDSDTQNIDVSAVLAIRMQWQHRLNSNVYDEEAKSMIAKCDVKIKQWNDANATTTRTSTTTTHATTQAAKRNDRWSDRKHAKEKTRTTSPRKPFQNARPYNQQEGQGRNERNHNKRGGNSGGDGGVGRGGDVGRCRGANGKKYLESWTETMNEDPEMNLSNRQRKRQIYGMAGQAWTREDFFERLPPMRSTFGIKMLRGMGWRHGQAIGKSREGHTAPVPVDVRFGRQGLCTKEEKEKFNLQQGRPKPVKKTNPIPTLNGKHPVSLLAEQCMKRQIQMPKYETVFEYGNFHSKSILVSVTVTGKTFEPSQPSPYRKHGKAMAAAQALKELEWVKEEIGEINQEEEGKGEEEGEKEKT